MVDNQLSHHSSWLSLKLRRQILVVPFALYATDVNMSPGEGGGGALIEKKHEG